MDQKITNAGESNEKVYDIPLKDTKAQRFRLIKRIEDVNRLIIISISQGKKPYLTYNDGKDSGWNNTNYNNNYTNNTMDSITTGETNNRSKTIRFSAYRNRQRFAIIMKIISKVHLNLIEHLEQNNDDFYRTKRSFFYELRNENIKRFIANQETVNRAINEITLILECAPWEIGFISTSKGLVAGDLTLHLGDSKVIKYEQQSCQAVPDVVANVTKIRTRANFVLVVEKDSVFQKLLRENCALYNQCILITGKGYPDIPTRMLVNLLSIRAQLPVYAFVDANPHGFEIMCVYRFGTLNNLGYREQLLCPGMRWLGIHQKDLVKLGITRIRLTKRDYKKAEELQKRNYIDHVPEFMQNLQSMRFGKAEIESVNKPDRFLTKFYIPWKIRKCDYC